MSIDRPPAADWHRSLESVLSEKRSVDAFRLWLKLHRRDDALDIYLGIIAFRRHARRGDPKASSVAFGIQKRFLNPKSGLCDFLSPTIRSEVSSRISSIRNSGSRPPLELFDPISPIVWSFLTEQHSLFVCSKEFASVVSSTEVSHNQQRRAEIIAARNATANGRVPPLIGFAKYRVRANIGFGDSSENTEAIRHRPKSEPPGKRCSSKPPEAEGDRIYPQLRHDRPEDRALFVSLLSDRLAPLATTEEWEDEPQHSETDWSRPPTRFESLPKSLSIGFADLEDRADDEMFAVHKHLIAPLSLKSLHNIREPFRLPPPPAPPLFDSIGHNHQRTDSSGFCSSESAWDYGRRQMTVSYKDEETGVPIVAHIDPRPLIFRDFRRLFGIPSDAPKRFLFKSESDDGMAPFQWTVAIGDFDQLPIFRGQIYAECRNYAD